jgi:hypothetical protein
LAVNQLLAYSLFWSLFTLKCITVVGVLAEVLLLSFQPARATDLRFDVITFDYAAESVELPSLDFPSANGHVINMGSATYAQQINAQGNTLGNYYNNFNTQTDGTALFADDPNPHDAAEVVQGWINSEFTSGQNGWVALNEVSSSTWNGSNGNAYRTWLIGVVKDLKLGDNSDPAHPIPAHTGVILFAPFANPGSSNAATWEAITQYAYVGDECYINGPTVQSDNFSVSTVQQTYQKSFNSWTVSAGVPASRLILSEEYTNSLAGNGFGADGLSGSTWQEAIEARDLAAYNVGFGGYIGYAWHKNDQNSSFADLESYEAAYASTMVVQTEVPTWTGEDGSTSWADYLNWTGGLPSTVNAPYPLLATTNPNLPKQTAANFLDTIQTPTTITMDGNQSITTMSFGSIYAYTLAPGTGGVLTFAPTLTFPNPSLTVTLGSHSITADVALAGNLAVNLAGNLTLSGALTTAGNTLTKTGIGTLTISGTQNHSAGSAIIVAAGVLNLNSDAGSSSNKSLALSTTGGSVNLNAAQHLFSLSLAGGNATMLTDGQSLLTRSFSISNGSTLDLRNNDMIVDYTSSSPLASIRTALASGYAQGNWSGSGITTSSAGSHPATTLGFAEASDVLGLTGSATGTFDGQTVDATTVLVKFTWLGDANLDGIVDASDLARISATGTTWASGDFNYDGVVNADDYALFALGDAEQQGNISTITPEPSLLCLLLLPLCVAPRRSRGISPRGRGG